MNPTKIYCCKKEFYDEASSFSTFDCGKETSATFGSPSPTAPNENLVRAYSELTNKYLEQRRELQRYKEQNAVCVKHDIAPIMQTVFSDNNVTIRIKQGRHPRLTVNFEDGMYVCYWGKRMLGYSPFRDGMLKEVNETFVFLWQEYVIEYEKDNCARDAILLHNKLIKNFEEC